jgi:hypothetical protein
MLLNFLTSALGHISDVWGPSSGAETSALGWYLTSAETLMRGRLHLLKWAFVASAVLPASQVGAQCPDYTSYSQSPHAPLSGGPLALPYMRPAPACRTFNSTAVEKVITDMKALLKDSDLARLFENTFPNTLGQTLFDNLTISFILMQAFV